MIEAVGEAYWPTYLSALDGLLAPGGRVGLQAITIAHDRLMATRRSYTWIHKYVFPGGIIPSIRAISDNLAAHTALRSSSGAIGPHYARTLAAVAGAVPRQLGEARRLLRRHVPADVGVLPRLLRGRLPRRAISASASWAWPGTRSGS